MLESKLLEKVYDRYQVSLSDMQVIVGRVKDNWKHAHLRGSSQVWSLTHCYFGDFSQSRINCEKVCFQQTHNQGLRQLLLTVS